METGYIKFVERLRRELLRATGKKEEEIFFCQKEEKTTLPKDRLYVQCRRTEEAWEMCSLKMREAYESYLSGMAMTDIVQKMAGDVEKLENAGFLQKISVIEDYETAKKTLFVRLLNLEENREDLKRAVYRTIGDIAMVLYLQIEETDERLSSLKVREEFLEKWEVDKETVFQEALLNTYYLSPPRIFLWEKLVFDPDYTGENFMDLLSNYKMKADGLGNCLSTARRTNGAVAVFLPGVARRLAELLPGSFYMVFTSIHEVMIHRDTLVDPQSLLNVLKDTIKAATPKEDILSYKIYHYNKDTEEFTCI